MLKGMYADVLFPLKISPLTYRIPVEMPKDIKGAVVEAPLMGRSAYGLVVNVSSAADPSLTFELKEIRSVHRSFASARALQFLKWLSDYYITPGGIALKSCFFEEAVAFIGGDRSGRKASGRARKPGADHSRAGAPEAMSHHLEFLNFDANADSVSKRTTEGRYGSFLLPTPFVFYEYLFLAEVLRRISEEVRGIIILVPEIGDIPRLESLLRPVVGKRLCVLHSKLSKGKRVETVGTILSSETDIVLGTRSAVLAPLGRVSFVAVTAEHSSSYKGEERLRYHGRDVAVMRAFMENACTVLSSVCPSVESLYNARLGKYALLKSRGEYDLPAKDVKVGRWREVERPVIKIVDMKPGRKGTPSLSGELVKQAKGLIAGGERLLFLINRKGYSLIRCGECGHTEACGKCGTFLVFHKAEGRARCHRCGGSGPVADICPQCRGVNITLVGAGTERIKEEVKQLFERDAVVLQKGAAPALSLDTDTMPLIIGTAYAKRLEYSGAGDEAFGAAAFLNMDMLLSQPDFRAYERTFQEVMQIVQMVKSGGSIFLQTHMPKNRVLRFIKNYDLDGFYDYELAQRRALDYPPFSRMVLLTVQGKEQTGMSAVRNIMEEGAAEGVELLGPAEVPCPSKGYTQCLQLLLKSKDRKALHSAAGELVAKLEEVKGTVVRPDVDPLVI
jgi:primosomal protein N' (replication factor Y)